MKRTSLSLAIALSGCVTEYAYVPVEHGTSQVSGQTGAAYAIPPEAPQGDVRVASFGITRLRVNTEEIIRALHLRMTLANRGNPRDRRGALKRA
jgi:hypothetical protein